jgi:hypothetical protein
MTLLSPKGLHAVEELAHRTGFSQEAVTSMLFSIVSGRGGMAQFSHPEFGGSGQWMAGGAVMISDMFNNGLKARVDALCNELSALIRSEPDFVAAASFQSQSQGANGNLKPRSSSLLEAEGHDQSDWWPSDLGVPSSLGAQEVRYAYFPATRRLAIDTNGKVTVYDTQDHQISGFSQQQPGSGSLTFSLSPLRTSVSGRLFVPTKKTTAHRSSWSKEDVKELKAHSKARTPVANIAKARKRTEGALRRKAGILGIGLGHDR